MSAPIFAVSETLADSVREHAQAHGVAVRLARIGKEGNFLDAVGEPRAVQAGGTITPRVLGRLLEEHRSIEWVAVTSAGVDQWLVPQLKGRPISLTRSRRIHDVPVAEFAMAFILAACKRLHECFRAQERKEWLGYQSPFVTGRTLTIVGYGEIGRALAKRAKAFDMRVVGVRTRPEPDEFADEVVGVEQLEPAIRQGDYVVVAVPGGAATRKMIAATQLRWLQEHAYFINVGRGEVVDELALDEALRAERFAGALLDTFAVEPLPQDSPLWTNPRVVITPHLAGLRLATLALGVLDQLVENIRRLGAGEPLLNTVDIERGY
ncbi:MAG: D-2-hydroxyacid dehydrogenase [Chloroflexi bacterium]|nr:D-2-hydroxyacid dehydrogenase [Chloroflexota bacterium]